VQRPTGGSATSHLGNAVPDIDNDILDNLIIQRFDSSSCMKSVFLFYFILFYFILFFILFYFLFYFIFLFIYLFIFFDEEEILN
jgi:hypothetical protein